MRTKKTAQGEAYLVVIPWRRNGAQGHELEYAVAGWRKHFLEKHIIVVVGEDDPGLEGVRFVYSRRVPGRDGQYRQHLDYVSCFKKVRKLFPQDKGFIFVADDVYAVNDFDITDVKVLKRFGGAIRSRIDDPNPWQRDKAKTKGLLLAEGYPIINYTTHLPQWYDWELLEQLWRRYDMEHESYLMEDLYYNIYFGDRLAINVYDSDDNVFNIYLRGVYRKDPRVAKIEEALTTRIWINNSVDGWVPALDRILKRHYFGE